MFLIVTSVGGLLVGGAVAKGIIDLRRANHLREYVFPHGIRQRLARRFPGYTRADWDAVLEGLRQWFEVARRAKGRHVAMPSRAVDEAWHELILDTVRYREFCDRALGGFLHHRPAEPMRAPRDAQEGIRRCWRLACEAASIDPKRPRRLPELFALDAALGFPGGHHYRLGTTPQPNEETKTEVEFDAEAIGCVSDGSSGGDGGGCGGGGD
jgi:hypothetical protein